jgi:hypothetical protein
MVFIEDTGSIYDVPLNMVWKLGEAHLKEGNKIHANTIKNKTKILNQTTFIISSNQEDDYYDANAQTIRM